MQIKIETHSDEFLSAEEATQNIKNLYGSSAKVSVSPDSDSPYSYLYFAIQELAANEFLSSYIDSHDEYKGQLKDQFVKETIRYIEEAVIPNVIEDMLEKI